MARVRCSSPTSSGAGVCVARARVLLSLLVRTNFHSARRPTPPLGQSARRSMPHAARMARCAPTQAATRRRRIRRARPAWERESDHCMPCNLMHHPPTHRVVKWRGSLTGARSRPKWVWLRCTRGACLRSLHCYRVGRTLHTNRRHARTASLRPGRPRLRTTRSTPALVAAVPFNILRLKSRRRCSLPSSTSRPRSRAP